MTIVEAAKKGAEWMRWWLEHSECDCEAGHNCGLHERRTELREIEAAIRAHESSDPGGAQ